jgi:uncharacterized oligopeptide transporter (OPT) family protein
MHFGHSEDMEYDHDTLEDILRLTRENNRMLHAMRRNAFLGGIVRFIVWAALIVIPLWLYMQYLAPVMDSMMNTMQQIQGTGAQAQAQFGDLSDTFKKLQAQFPQYFQGQ